jgi:hypothetical protein
MKAKEWDVLRREAYAKNNYCCWACGTHHPFDKDRNVFIDKKLHAHESYNIDYEACTMELVEIVALCELCHNTIHSGRMNALYDKNELDEEDCWLIISQKERVLGDEQVNINPNHDFVQNWEKWVLIIDGKKHGSKFKNYEEWQKHYS